MGLLESLIAEIQTGNTLETHSLAARLHTSPRLIQAMLEHLERSGYLRRFSACDPSACGGCTLADTCHTSLGGAQRLWVWNNESGGEAKQG